MVLIVNCFFFFFLPIFKHQLFAILKALMLNSKSKGKSTAGEMVNLMSVDAQRLMELMAYINSLWSSPLQIAGSLYFLYNTLGLSVLAGLGVMILIIPLNMLFGSKMGTLQVSKHALKEITRVIVVCLV